MPSSPPQTAEVRLKLQAVDVGRTEPSLGDREGMAEDTLYSLWLQG